MPRPLALAALAVLSLLAASEPAKASTYNYSLAAYQNLSTAYAYSDYSSLMGYSGMLSPPIWYFYPVAYRDNAYWERYYLYYAQYYAYYGYYYASKKKLHTARDYDYYAYYYGYYGAYFAYLNYHSTELILGQTSAGGSSRDNSAYYFAYYGYLAAYYAYAGY